MGNKKIQSDTLISGTSIDVDKWKNFRRELIKEIICRDTEPKQENWQGAFKIFNTRIETRFLNPIDWILEKRIDSGEGFSVVALQCILIEFLEAFYQGKVYTTSKSPNAFEYNSSKKLFSDFLMGHKPFSDYFKTNANANGFFDNIRCGLLHEAATKQASRINNAPNHNRLVLFEDNDPTNMRIYRENFYTAILEYIESYKMELLTNRQLQINFVRKMDDICGIRHSYYFAYGSNMDRERLITRIGIYHTAFSAILENYKFVYNKKSKDGSAKANIEEAADKIVHGVCYEIDHDAFEELKKCESGYDQRDIVVVSTKKDVKTTSVTYISKSIDNTLLATNEYKNIVIKGAKDWELDKSYIAEYLDR